MIRVTVELVSAIDPSRNRILGVATIANTGDTSQRTAGARGDYDVVLSKAGAQVNQAWKRGRVVNFPRRARGGWDLLYLALRDCVGGRNP